MITEELKKRIVASLAETRQLFDGSDAKFAISLGINNSQYSRIKNGDTTKVLADSVWISLARRQGISVNNTPEWKIANTPVFQFITAQLEICQNDGISSLLCDLSDIGKTVAALHYSKTHKNAVYCDCSQVKSKQKMIRYIAKEFGVGNTGKYADVYEDLVYYLKTLPNPLIILDEAGDLQYDAFLEIKALWNATEHTCGYYMLGAESLQEKMRRAIDHKKVGYTELFSRFGKKYGKVIPIGKEDSEKLLNHSAALIIKANAVEGTDVNKMLRQTMGEDDRPSLRRIYTKITTAE
jgi:hypothetical protein